MGNKIKFKINYFFIFFCFLFLSTFSHFVELMVTMAIGCYYFYVLEFNCFANKKEYRYAHLDHMIN
jgi:hypothetical protein